MHNQRYNQVTGLIHLHTYHSSVIEAMTENLLQSGHKICCDFSISNTRKSPNGNKTYYYYKYTYSKAKKAQPTWRIRDFQSDIELIRPKG